MIGRERFETDAQFRKFNEISAYVQRVIDVQEKGASIYENGIQVDGKLFIDGERIGVKSGNCSIVYIGLTHGYNKKTEEYDLLWVDYTSLGKFKKQHKFEMVEKFIPIN